VSDDEEILAHAYKAQPAGKYGKKGRDARILIHGDFPAFSGPDWEKDSAARHQQDAEVIFYALSQTLPGGTLNRLHALMVKHYAGLWTIPLPGEGGSREGAIYRKENTE